MMQVEDFKNLVGKTIEDANKDLPQKYFIFVAMSNGQSFYRSLEYNPYRINVWTKGEVISKIDSVS